MDGRVPRRRFLLGSAGLSAAVLANACKRSVTCPPSPLSPDEAKLRETLHYTDHSPDPRRLCSGCQQYEPSSSADCGGCRLMKGLIHPAGYCVAFSSMG